jgi:hypothetical protein
VTTASDLLEAGAMSVLQQITHLIGTGDLTVVVSRAVGQGQVAQALTESMTGHARDKTTVIVSSYTAQK